MHLTLVHFVSNFKRIPSINHQTSFLILIKVRFFFFFFWGGGQLAVHATSACMFIYPKKVSPTPYSFIYFENK